MYKSKGSGNRKGMRKSHKEIESRLSKSPISDWMNHR